MTRFALAAFAMAFFLAPATPAAAHCQIPCGIYDDELRVQLIEEHITTVEKSMNQIVALGKASPVDYNQLVRWVNNKEEHAQKIQDIVTAYFMAQRIKPPKDHSDEEAMNEYLRARTSSRLKPCADWSRSSARHTSARKASTRTDMN